MLRTVHAAIVVSLAATAMALGGCAGDDSPGARRATPSASAEPTATSVVGHVDVGGRSLHYACEGVAVEGEPTIVLLAGAGLGVDSWYPLAGDIGSAGHHVCAFDRAGFGASDPAPERRRSSSDTVDDLLAAWKALDLPAPYVVVAHSAAGLEAALLADRVPHQLAGVVLVDPLGPHVDDALRAVLPPERPGESLALADERRFLTADSVDPSRNPEHLDITAGEHEAAAVLDRPGRLFGDLPVVVLQAPPPVIAGLPADYLATLHSAVAADMEQYAAESTNGTLVHVHHTGHMIMVDQPQAVTDAIDRVLAR